MHYFSGKQIYRKIVVILYLLILFFGTVISNAQENSIPFTDEEKQWIGMHSTLRLGVGIAFPPFMLVEKENGQHVFRGMVSDYVNLLSEKLGMDMQIIFDIPFDKALALGKSGRIDLFPCISKTPERSEFLLFTDPYLSYPIVIITQENAPMISGVKDLEGKRFATVKHLLVYSRIRSNYSHLDIDYVFTNKVEENIEAVSLGRADACIINLAAASYYIQKKGITNLKIAAPVNWKGIQLSMGVRKDWPILEKIIEKGLTSISQEEKDKISQKWIQAEYYSGVPIAKIWRWSLGIGLFVIISFVLISIWNRRLQKEIVERKKVEADLQEAQAIARLGNWEMDVNSEWIKWSDENFKIFGIENTKDRGLSFNAFMEFVHPDDHVIIYELWENLATEGNSEFEYRAVRPDGEIRWISGRGKTYFDEASTPVKMFGIIQDITDRKQAENNLKTNETKLKNIIEHSTNLFYSHTTDHKITFVSPQIREYLGYEPEEVMTRWTDLITDNPMNEKAIEFNQEAVRTGKQQPTYELEMQHKNGSKIIVEVREAPVVENGLVTAIVGSLVDITQRKEAEKSLNESSRLNELMLNSLPHPAMLIDKKRIVLAANKIAVETGVEIGKFCWDTFGHRESISDVHKQRLNKDSNCVKDDILCTFCLANDLIKTNVPQNAPEVLAFGKVWDTWWVPIDENTYLHFAIDITERKLAADHLRKEVERSKLLLELYLKAPELSDKELYEYTLNKAVDLTDSTIGFFHEVSEDQENIILNTWNSETLKTCKADYGTHYLIEKAGNWVDCIHTKKTVVYNDYSASPNQKGLPEGHIAIERFMSIPVVEEEKIRYIFGVGNKSVNYNDYDVTQIQLVANELYNIIKQRSAESELENLQEKFNQAQKMESIGNLAGGIAHDFNNILSSVIGFTELSLVEAEKDSILEDNLQEVYSAGKRAKELVSQILAFARQSEEKVKPLQPSVIAKEVLKFIRSSIPSTIEIKQMIESDSFVMGNPTQIHQVFMNLCTNAAYAMEEEGGVIEVSMNDISIASGSYQNRAGIKTGDYIQITVSDTGTGIPPEIIHSIFEPYFTTKKPGEGTGMGLAMVQGMVESYGGKIIVDSIPGKGSTFNVYIPITKKRKFDHTYKSEDLPSGSEKILFVDDEAPIVKMGRRILEELGYSVETRTSSVEALDFFKSKPDDFDLVISDMTMPNITGDMLATELMTIRPDIPVILCTGYSKKITDETAFEIGIKAFAYKPMVKADLARTVRNVLDKAKGKV